MFILLADALIDLDSLRKQTAFRLLFHAAGKQFSVFFGGVKQKPEIRLCSQATALTEDHFVFEYFCDSRRILATFAKFCLNFSQHDRTVTQIPNTSSSARSSSPPSPIHAFLTRLNFTNTSPVRSFSCAYEVA